MRFTFLIYDTLIKLFWQWFFHRDHIISRYNKPQEITHVIQEPVVIESPMLGGGVLHGDTVGQLYLSSFQE